MKAKVHVVLPFELLVPQTEVFRLYSYEQDGYEIEIGLPTKSDVPTASDVPIEAKVNDKLAVVANSLTITFKKESFERAISAAVDPPESLIATVVDTVLDHLKYVTNASQVRDVGFPSCIWRLQYLNDDDSELVMQEGFFRTRSARQRKFSFVACDPQIWDAIFSLPTDFRAPPWHTLLVDSRGALPHVGTAVVLVATALEVFISDVLSALAKPEKISPSLWKWISNRGNWLKDPSVEEQFDILLKELCGHSLKEEMQLWDAFKNIRTIRNAFAHEGIPRLGGKSVSVAEALAFILKADSIVATVREWLPDECKWPVFKLDAQIRFTAELISAAAAVSID